MDPKLQSWAVPQCPFTIEYPAGMMNRLRIAVMEAFFAIPRGGLEIGGVLFGTINFGTINRGRVLVQAFRTLECEHAAGPSFTLSETDRARLAELLATAPEDRELAGLAPVGWFRSRTRSGIALSEADVAFFDSYFPDTRQVALVLRPEVTRPTRAGFFFREKDGALRTESTFSEFIVEAEAAPVEAPQPPQPAPELRFLEVAAAPRPWRLWVLAVCLLLAAASLAAREYLANRTPAPEPLSLQVQDRDGQLQLQWDHTSRPVRQARGAKLEITDGGELLRVSLAAAQLQRGSFYYVRMNDRVDIHMTVLEKNGGSSHEYAIFIGHRPE